METILLAKKEVHLKKYMIAFLLYSNSLEHSPPGKERFWWDRAAQMTDGSLMSDSINQRDIVKEPQVKSPITGTCSGSVKPEYPETGGLESEADKPNQKPYYN